MPAFEKKDSNEEDIRCSFCGKRREQVSNLIAGPGVYICSQCVDLCNDIIVKEEPQAAVAEADLSALPKPAEIYDILQQYVIGQEQAKRVLSVAVYNHYKRLAILENDPSPEVELEKSNICLIGPTGCGKTLLARTLARMLNVPFAIADATNLTEAGYVGEDVENILLKLLQASDGNIDQAQRGIIYLDEIDKITRKSDNPSLTRDVSGEGVQQGLLKILEGTIAAIPPEGGRKHPQQEYTKIDTTGILFICGGAFEGLEDIIARRVRESTIGFRSIPTGKITNTEERSRLLMSTTPDDLMKFGFIPEFIGRLPMIATLTPLDEEAMVRILTEPRNAITRQFIKMLKADGVELTFEPEALSAIAHKALERKTGARALRSVLEEVMTNVMFDVPSTKGVTKCVIKAETINDGVEPQLVTREDQLKTIREKKKQKIEQLDLDQAAEAA